LFRSNKEETNKNNLQIFRRQQQQKGKNTKIVIELTTQTKEEMNESKVDDIKKLCGYLLIQTTEQSILKDIGFHLETAWRGNSQENKKDNTVQDNNIKREVLNSS